MGTPHQHLQSCGVFWHPLSRAIQDSTLTTYLQMANDDGSFPRVKLIVPSGHVSRPSLEPWPRHLLDPYYAALVMCLA
jgi:hypothetical protein